ncbi:MAG TPA: formylmethanofuran dehydrogenase subunit E family protein, partial [Spirochaetota bacterium]|nr:formylmethanofuran dehydrogenase subunit E family protein [Spirochaetota bacterium]
MMKHGTSDRKIGPLTAEEYIEKGKSFHGSMAPGLLIGGFMVDYARKNLPGGEFFDVISETGHCLPDAVQLLTPCTIGNGWLKIIDTGRFAITFYDKSTGDGVRVYLDQKKLESWV